MGNEADVTARIGAKKAKTHALLETKELILRGELRATFAFERMREVAAKGATLSFVHDGERVALEVGPQAARWAEKIKNPRSRIDKLGIKPGQVVAVQGVDDAALPEELAARGARVAAGKAKGCDAVFLGLSTAADLKKISACKAQLKPDGALWLIRPKGANAAVGELPSMAAGKAAGLVDVKVVAFSETHSAMKFVIPLAKRGK